MDELLQQLKANNTDFSPLLMIEIVKNMEVVTQENLYIELE